MKTWDEWDKAYWGSRHPRPLRSFPMEQGAHILACVYPTDCTQLAGSTLNVFSVTQHGTWCCQESWICCEGGVGGNNQNASCLGKAEDTVLSPLIKGDSVVLSVNWGKNCGTEMWGEKKGLILFNIGSSPVLRSVGSEVETESSIPEKELSGNRWFSIVRWQSRWGGYPFIHWSYFFSFFS